MDREVFRQPARFFDSRTEAQMPAFRRSTETARNKQFVVRLTTAASGPALSFHDAGHADGDRRGADRRACLSTDYTDVELGRSLVKAAIEIACPADFRC